MTLEGRRVGADVGDGKLSAWSLKTQGQAHPEFRWTSQGSVPRGQPAKARLREGRGFKESDAVWDR